MASEVHVEPARDATTDEARALQLPVPPAVNRLRARALLRVGAHREPLLALRPTPVVDLLRRVEEEVVRFRRSSDVGEVGAEEESEFGEHRPSKR